MDISKDGGILEGLRDQHHWDTLVVLTSPTDSKANRIIITQNKQRDINNKTGQASKRVLEPSELETLAKMISDDIEFARSETKQQQQQEQRGIDDNYG